MPGFIHRTGRRVVIGQNPAGRWVWKILARDGLRTLAIAAADYGGYNDARVGAERAMKTLKAHIDAEDPPIPAAKPCPTCYTPAPEPKVRYPGDLF